MTRGRGTEPHWAAGATGAAIGLLAVGAAGLLGASCLPFDVVRSWLDAWTADGHADLFTKELFDRIVIKARLGSGALALVCALGYVARRPIARYLDQLVSDAVTAIAAARRLGDTIRREPPSHWWTLSIIVLVAIGTRLCFLSQPMRYDEAFTFMQYVSKPLVVGLSRYFPNNHLFHTFLAHLTAGFFGTAPWAIRLPAFLAGVLLVPAAYVVARQHYGRHAALVAAGLVAASSPLVGFSTVARGYTLMLLCFLTIAALAPSLLRQRNRAAWALFALVSALGFYTVPLMLYPFGVVVVWLILSVAAGESPLPRQHVVRDLLLAVGLTVGLAALLYLPSLVVTGVSSLTTRGIATVPSWADLLRGHLKDLRYLWAEWNRDVPVAISLLLIIGCLIATVAHRRLGRYRIPWVFAAALWCLPLLALQGIHPPVRMWLFLLPLYFAAAASGLIALMDRIVQTIARAVKAVPSYAVCVTALMLTVGVGLNVIRTRSVYYSDDTGTGLRDAEQIARFLKEELRPGDRILAATPSEAPLEYYLYRHQVPVTYLFTGLGFTNRLFIVVNEPRQTIDALVGPSLRGPEYTEPALVQRYRFASLYEIRQRP